MPVYTYKCRDCGVEFKKTQMFADKPLRRCPKCRTSKVWRVPQLPAIVFNGSGWYSTDHRPATGQTSLQIQKNGQFEGSTGAKSER
jgi:putative FmdB family regulatory protein